MVLSDVRFHDKPNQPATRRVRISKRINHLKILVKIPSESISEYLIFKNLLGGHAPRPPSNSMLRMLVVLRKILINLLKQPLHILIVWPDHFKIASYAPGVAINFFFFFLFCIIFHNTVQ